MNVYSLVQGLKVHDFLWRPGQVVGYVGEEPVQFVEGSPMCDHETCYEKHEAVAVFKCGDVYVGRRCTWSSYGGMEWKGHVFTVAPIQTVQFVYERLDSQA